MNKIWYKKPAKWWMQALPLGNGKTGIMVYGGRRVERLAFNDSTLWSGYPKEQNNPDSLRYLSEVREKVFNGDNLEAQKIAESKLIGKYSESYLPFGHVKILFSGAKFGNGMYKRELDLNTGIHTVNLPGVTRETFVSYQDNVAVYHIKSDKKTSVKIAMSSKLKSHVIAENFALNLVGNAPDYVAPSYVKEDKKPIRYDQQKGMSFCLRLETKTDGQISVKGKYLVVKNAREITLYMSTATGYISAFENPITDVNECIEKCKNILAKCTFDYKSIKCRHINDYKSLYDRQKFSLYAYNDLPTNVLLKKVKKNYDNKSLCELLYNYGKYLTIVGSREGGQAMNLQGLWNNSIRPPWSSNYTTNINVEMNYWGASNCALQECLVPYIELVKEILTNGKKTAKINYGCNGFACNHNVDIWKKTSPVTGNCCYMYAPLCGVWLASEIYRHYKNGGLEKYREDVVEIVTQATIFAKEYLVEHNGYLVTAPSASPENTFFNEKGEKCELDYASAFEMGLVRDIFENYIEMNLDNILSEEIKNCLCKLYPFTIGEYGVNEWHKNYKVVDRGHRHFSPLYALYPGRVVKYYKDVELREEFAKAYYDRINHTDRFFGWSGAWAINIAGRLHDGETVEKLLQDFLKNSISYNLFDVHPPFVYQIDGNMGYLSGVNEALVYIENDIIELLPALPKGWEKGSMTGFVIGGNVIDFAWENGKVNYIKSKFNTKILHKNISDNCRSENVNFVERIL